MFYRLNANIFEEMHKILTKDYIYKIIPAFEELQIVTIYINPDLQFQNY